MKKGKLYYEKANKEVFSIFSNGITEITVRHVIGITGRSNLNKPIEDVFDVYGKSYNESTIKPITFYMKTSDYILIESRRYKNTLNQNSDYERYNKYCLLKNSFVYMEELLNEIKNKLETTEDLFLLKDNGEPSNVFDKYNNLNWLLRTPGKHTEFISFKPHVIRDRDANYVGLQITCHQGLIGEISYDQFLYFYKALINLMDNFYTASLNLYNAALNNIIIRQNQEEQK